MGMPDNLVAVSTPIGKPVLNSLLRVKMKGDIYGKL